MRQHTMREVVRYRFDNAISSGTAPLIAWLALITVGIVLGAATVITLMGVGAGGAGQGFTESLWQNMLRVFDPGTMADDVGWPLRTVSLVVTVAGILLASTLVGLLANGIAEKLASLQRGRSQVIEAGHTLVLGWSPKVFAILSELAIANESEKDPRIVVLAQLDKGEMDRLIEDRVKLRNTRVICRSGTPSELANLRIANAPEARSVIVLNPQDEVGDAHVIRTVLALLRSDLPDSAPIIAEVTDPNAADALRRSARGRVTVVESYRVIARITAQVSRQPGLSAVYSDLLDFEGDEIYFYDDRLLEGMTFGQALVAFSNCAVIGMRTRDGVTTLNPDMHRRIEQGEKVIVIAEDDTAISVTRRDLNAPTSNGSPAAARELTPERILVLGWNDLGPLIVRELDHYVAPDSRLTIAVDDRLVDPNKLNLPVGIRNVEVIKEAGPADPNLSELLTRHPAEHVIILCYRRGISEANADARALLMLLQLRHAAEELGLEINVVTELLDVQDVELAGRTERDEFIVSERLTSLLMAQLSENVELEPVFEDLLDASGSELYLKPMHLYHDGGEVTFGNLVESALHRGEIAIGYQQAAAEPGVAPTVSLNPPKSDALHPAVEDRLIVLAQSED